MYVCKTILWHKQTSKLNIIIQLKLGGRGLIYVGKRGKGLFPTAAASGQWAVRGFSCKKRVLSIYWKNPKGSGPRMWRIVAPREGSRSPQIMSGRCDRPAWKRPHAAGRGCQGSSSEGAGEASGQVRPCPAPSRPPPGRSLRKLPGAAHWQGLSRCPQELGGSERAAAARGGGLGGAGRRVLARVAQGAQEAPLSQARGASSGSSF